MARNEEKAQSMLNRWVKVTKRRHAFKSAVFNSFCSSNPEQLMTMQKGRIWQAWHLPCMRLKSGAGRL
jgi:hypothetical protein